MTLRLNGYLRDNPGGNAVAGATVNLLDVNTGIAPVTTAFTNLSGTSAVTDATGKWTFTMDLCTGPLRVEALLGGANKRHRRPDEVYQYEGFFINQVDQALQAFTNGIIHGVGNNFNVTASATRILTIDTGYGLIKGFPIGWDTGTKAITGVNNGAAGTTRWDLLVLRQWYNGTSIGKQDIVIVQGSNGADPVATSSEADLTKYIQGPNIWDVPICRATLAFNATVYTVVDLGISKWASIYLTGVNGSFSVGDDLTVADTLTVNGNVTNLGGTQLGNTASDVVTLYGHIETAGSGPSVSGAANPVCVGGSQSITQGNDTSFTVTGTTKSPPSNGDAFVITFAQARSSSNYGVTITPRTSGASGGNWFVTSKGTAGFSIDCNNVLSNGVTITLDVHVI